MVICGVGGYVGERGRERPFFLYMAGLMEGWGLRAMAYMGVLKRSRFDTSLPLWLGGDTSHNNKLKTLLTCG